MKELEEGTTLVLNFAKLEKAVAASPGIIPVAVQDADTRELLVLAYVNEQALRRSVETRRVTFWSTSRNELWTKGATSGDTFDLVEVRVNCEQNSLLFLVRPRAGGMCHTRDAQGRSRTSCYYRRLDLDTGKLAGLDE